MPALFSDLCVSDCSSGLPSLLSVCGRFASTDVDEGASSFARVGMSCAGDLVSALPGSGLSLADIVNQSKTSDL